MQETDLYLKIERKVMSFGFAIDSHEVITTDGYILKLIRLGKVGARNKKVALL